MKDAFLLFTAIFGIAVTTAGGLFQLARARHARAAGNPNAGAIAVMGWAALVLAALTVVIVMLGRS